jgi:hypothetical protein
MGNLLIYSATEDNSCIWQQASAAAFTQQVHLALFMDCKLDAGACEHLSSARRWRRHAPFTNR